MTAEDLSYISLDELPGNGGFALTVQLKGGGAAVQIPTGSSPDLVAYKLCELAKLVLRGANDREKKRGK
jgi:hypothetical protein